MHLVLLVLCAPSIKHVWSLPPSHEAHVGEDLWETSAKKTSSLTTEAKLFRVNLSQGVVVDQWQFWGSVIAESVVILLIIEAPRYALESRSSLESAPGMKIH